MTPVRLEPTTSQSRVKNSTTEPLRSHLKEEEMSSVKARETRERTNSRQDLTEEERLVVKNRETSERKKNVDRI